MPDKQAGLFSAQRPVQTSFQQGQSGVDTRTQLEHLQPEIKEHRLWNMRNIFLAVLLGVVGIIIEYVGVNIVGLNTVESLILGVIIVVIYAIVLFFLLEPEIMREVRMTSVKTVERHVDRPVIKEVVRTVDRPVEKRVYVDRPVIKEVVRTIDRPVVRTIQRFKKVYVEKPRKKLNIPSYNYLGSSETKTYHKHGCRFSKLIKKKYKVSNNSANYFRARKYKPCEICILKTKKV